jgi:mRNA-decapping enzyme subunit 1
VNQVKDKHSLRERQIKSHSAMNKGSKKKNQKEAITTEEAVNLYRSALNFNVISRYDPAIKQLLCHTSHCVIYKFEESEEWVKSDYQGTLALYLRDYQVPNQSSQQASLEDLQNLFCYGLILLNRNNPKCFSVGLLPNKITKHIFPKGVDNSGVLEMDVELNDNLIIVKTLLGEIYGLWVFNEADRLKLFKSIEYCLNSDSAF